MKSPSDQAHLERWPIDMLRGFYPEWKPTAEQAAAVVSRFSGITDAPAMKAAAERCWLRTYALRPKIDDILAEYGIDRRAALAAPEATRRMPTRQELESDRQAALAHLRGCSEDELAEHRRLAREVRRLPIGPDVPLDAMSQQAVCWLAASSRTPLLGNLVPPDPLRVYALRGEQRGASAQREERNPLVGLRKPTATKIDSESAESVSSADALSHTALASDPAPACFAPSLGSLPAGVVDEEYERQMGGWGDD